MRIVQQSVIFVQQNIKPFQCVISDTELNYLPGIV